MDGPLVEPAGLADRARLDAGQYPDPPLSTDFDRVDVELSLGHGGDDIGPSIRFWTFWWGYDDALRPVSPLARQTSKSPRSSR